MKKELSRHTENTQCYRLFWYIIRDILLTQSLYNDTDSVLQQKMLRWYGHVWQKADNNWVKCMEHEVEGRTPKGWPKPTRTEVVEKGCKSVMHINPTGRMLWIVVDGGSWYRMPDDQDGCDWMPPMIPGNPGSPRQRAIKQLCVYSVVTLEMHLLLLYMLRWHFSLLRAKVDKNIN